MAAKKKILVTHVIFDFDGTLVNTIGAYKKSLREFAESHGKQLSPETEGIMK